MINLLDCTLRDGGYVNEWNWGFHTAKNIINSLVKAGIDVVEVGFLRNINEYDQNITVCNRIEELNRLLPKDSKNTMFSAMAMRSNYDIGKLSPYDGKGIEMIRITAHDYDIKEGLDFAAKVKEKGYKLSVNPINIMGYSDEQILWIINRVNEIQPFQFSIVDTFGSMKRRDLDRIVSLVDNNLNRDVRLSLHLHENMSLSCSLAQNFADKHLNRNIAIDGSLMGMGRIPGNLPIELIADYLNDSYAKSYDIDYLMDAIQDYISPLKGKTEWGYTPAYFLSARFNLHRNYAEHYLNKPDITNRDINHILSQFDRNKATVFDAEYADHLYEKYKNNIIDDSEDRENLKVKLKGKVILLIAPGASINSYKDKIDSFIDKNKPVIISVNFIPGEFKTDFAFFSNNKRLNFFYDRVCELIVTSNLFIEKADFVINYNSLSGAFKQDVNSLIMCMKLLENLEIEKVFVAGADGYVSGVKNYFDNSFKSYAEQKVDFNSEIADIMKNMNLDIEFITPSQYNIQ